MDLALANQLRALNFRSDQTTNHNTRDSYDVKALIYSYSNRINLSFLR